MGTTSLATSTSTLVACCACTIILLTALASISWVPLGCRTDSRFRYTSLFGEIIVYVGTALAAILVTVCTLLVGRRNAPLAGQRRRFGRPYWLTRILDDLLPRVLPSLGERTLYMWTWQQAIASTAAIFDCINRVSTRSNDVLKMLLLQSWGSVGTISSYIVIHSNPLPINYSWHIDFSFSLSFFDSYAISSLIFLSARWYYGAMSPCNF